MRDTERLRLKISGTVRPVMFLIFVFNGIVGMDAERDMLLGQVFKEINCKGVLISDRELKYMSTKVVKFICSEPGNRLKPRNDFLMVRIQNDKWTEKTRPQVYSRMVGMSIKHITEHSFRDQVYTFEFYTFSSELTAVDLTGHSAESQNREAVLGILEVIEKEDDYLVDRLVSFSEEGFFRTPETMYFIDFGHDPQYSHVSSFLLLSDFIKFSGLIREHFLSSFPDFGNPNSMKDFKDDCWGVAEWFQRFKKYPSIYLRSKLIERIITFLRDAQASASKQRVTPQLSSNPSSKTLLTDQRESKPKYTEEQTKRSISLNKNPGFNKYDNALTKRNDRWGNGMPDLQNEFRNQNRELRAF